MYLLGRTDLANVYLRRYKSLVGRINALTGEQNTAGEIRRNQGAECLYMIITLATADGEARSLFGEKTIGDNDGDGAPEFVDGWGNPINFLRWAPGFDSQVQSNANTLVNPPPAAANPNNPNDWQTRAATDHDPFDLFRTDAAAFRLVPLIYSPGRDEESGLHAAPEFVRWRLPSPPAVSVAPNNVPHLSPRLTPYGKGGLSSSDPYLGTAASDGTSTDNIHNHLLGLR
jgi:hypothetical protein